MRFYNSGLNQLSEENYSRTLVGWANNIDSISNGPFSQTVYFSGTTYNNTTYAPGSRFTNAYDARAFLVNQLSLSVSGATDTDADGSYLFNAATGLYTNSLGWYFLKSGSDWTLYDTTDTAQATGTGADPWLVTTWTGVLAGATLLNTGMGWTIIGDTAV